MHPSLRVLGLVLALSLPMATALADVAPPRIPGETYVTHRVQIQNMLAHPGFSLLVYDPPAQGVIRAHLVFHAETDAERDLVHGGSWRSAARFGTPTIWLLPRKEEQKWSKATANEVARQRQACAERAEGCVHISRFSPRYAPPAGAIDCGVSLPVVRSVPTERANKDRQVVDVFRLVQATKKTCKLLPVRRATP